MGWDEMGCGGSPHAGFGDLLMGAQQGHPKGHKAPCPAETPLVTETGAIRQPRLHQTCRPRGNCTCKGIAAAECVEQMTHGRCGSMPAAAQIPSYPRGTPT